MLMVAQNPIITTHLLTMLNKINLTPIYQFGSDPMEKVGSNTT